MMSGREDNIGDEVDMHGAEDNKREATNEAVSMNIAMQG